MRGISRKSPQTLKDREMDAKGKEKLRMEGSNFALEPGNGEVRGS